MGEIASPLANIIRKAAEAKVEGPDPLEGEVGASRHPIPSLIQMRDRAQAQLERIQKKAA